MKKYKIFTLGCKVNSYESEALAELLEKNGYIDGREYKNEEIDAVVINTCSVTSVSDQKSRQHIRKFIKEYPNATMVVMGCYAQMSSDFISEIEGVGVVVGTNNRHLIPELIEKHNKEHKVINIVEAKRRDFQYESLNLSNYSDNTRAYLKIQDGCNNFCTYCIIPYARGQLRSRPKEEVLHEVTRLVNNGFKEIILTGIDTGKYGKDFENYNLCDLLKDMLALKPTIQRLRISSIEVSEIKDDIIELLKNDTIIADHFHIPLQSGSDTVLQRMNRHYLTKDYFDKITKIRESRPNAAITTDVIVGFPGETEEEFEETYEFCKKCQFANLHVFPYSARSGTVAAKMKNQIDPRIKKERVRKLISLATQLQNKYESRFIGQELDVLFEEYDETTKSYKGHSSNYILVHQKSDEDLCHKMVKVIYKG